MLTVKYYLHYVLSLSLVCLLELKILLHVFYIAFKIAILQYEGNVVVAVCNKHYKYLYK